MAKEHDRNLNITISNQEEKSGDEVVISLRTVLKKLKKYLFLWIVIAVVFFAAAFGYATINTHIKKATLSALVSFSYTGIEKGLDPDGKKFEASSLYNPSVIQAAVEELGIDQSEIENIREGIKVVGLRPADAIDRITTYRSIMDSSSNGNLAAAQAMLDVSWNPTQFKVFFDYNNTSLSDSDAVDVFNEILNQYQTYFYESYGYNESLGIAVTAINYADYDYSEAVDVFANSLTALRKYVKNLADEDATRFRSSVTGYTFDDLYQAIRTIEGIDLDKISSYVTVNNLTKDKDEALAYYEYRIKALTRTKAQLEEEFAAYTDSIDNYVKDQIIIFGNGDQDTDTQVTQASAQYDKLISQKNNIASELAETKQSINYYKERQEALKSKPIGSTAQTDKVEELLADLNEKLDKLIESVALTSDDYYENVTFRNAYNVLVPASNTASNRLSRIIDNATTPLIVLEAIALLAFFAVSFIEALVCDTRVRRRLTAAEAGSPEEEAPAEEVAEPAEDTVEAEKDKKNKKK